LFTSFVWKQYVDVIVLELRWQTC